MTRTSNNTLIESDYIDITITPENLLKLKKGLSKILRKKKRIDIELTVNGHQQLARLNFHGSDDAHYQNNKYSYNIKMNRK